MKLNTIDGAFLMSQPLRPPNFVVDTLLSQGLHILAGSPKVGKSWLALWLAVTVAKGEPVWGMRVKRGTTLYLCLEDSVLRIQNRLFEITEDAPDSVHFCTECAPIGQGLEEQVDTFVAASPRHRAGHHRHPADGPPGPRRHLRQRLPGPVCAEAAGGQARHRHPAHPPSAEGERQRMCSTGSPAPPPSAVRWIPASHWWKKSGAAARPKLTCVGRDIEYRELELRRGE